MIERRAGIKTTYHKSGKIVARRLDWKPGEKQGSAWSNQYDDGLSSHHAAALNLIERNGLDWELSPYCATFPDGSLVWVSMPKP